MSLSPFEHPFLSGLFGDSEIVELFSARADIDAMVRFETALAQAEAQAGIFADDVAEAIVSGLSEFAADMTALRHGVAKDGVVVPELIRQMRAAVAGQAADKVHLGATSQDVIDTSLMLRLKTAAEIIATRLGHLIDTLGDLASRDGHNRLTGYTRMQAAIASSPPIAPATNRRLNPRGSRFPIPPIWSWRRRGRCRRCRRSIAAGTTTGWKYSPT